MTPDCGPTRRIRPEPTCRETGRRVHPNGDADTCPAGTRFPDTNLMSFIYNRLRRHSGWANRARIMHSPQLPADGSRRTRPTIIEET